MGRGLWQAVRDDARFRIDDVFDLSQEPGIDLGELMDLVETEAEAEGLAYFQKAV